MPVSSLREQSADSDSEFAGKLLQTKTTKNNPITIFNINPPRAKLKITIPMRKSLKIGLSLSSNKRKACHSDFNFLIIKF